MAPLTVPPPSEVEPAPALPVVQRAPSASGAIGALAASAATAVASTLRQARRERSETTASRAPDTPPPPPYEPPPPYSANHAAERSADPGGTPPEYSAVQGNGFDPRELSDFQLDELVHRIIGRITRLVRTELRMDRERIGRLRDPRF